MSPGLRINNTVTSMHYARVIQHHAADVRVQAARVRAESSALAVAAAAVVGATLSPVSPMCMSKSVYRP